MQPKTLQQRIALFVLIPVFFILVGMGWASFLYARNAMLKQWGETAVTNLQKAAHMIDMRLSKPKDLLLMLKNNGTRDPDFLIQTFIIDQLSRMPGVVDVKDDYLKNFGMAGDQIMKPMKFMMSGHLNRMEKVQLSLPQYDTKLHRETIALSSDFKNMKEETVGRIEVIMSFQDLIDQISKTTWWKSNKAFLIDNDGNILSATEFNHGQGAERYEKFGHTNALEKKTLAALKDSPHGTIFGPGHPPEEISGYYRLKEAPWSLVLISPGSQVLKSIVNFRWFYLIFGFLSILSVILVIRTTITGTTRAIKKVSEAAKDLADGLFGDQLPVLTKDEVGELTFNFNRMTKQLQERSQLKAAMTIAKEIQQSLLPPANVLYKNLEISGCSVYCDETGGDYFDIIESPDDPDNVYVAVGDVVGHGIGAALLMATTRALLRSRILQKGSLSQILNDVNHLICMDSVDTGSFVTFFLLKVDHSKRELQWIRAGHEPAMVYDPEKDEMTELYGEGIVLGLDDQWKYEERVLSDISGDTVVLICTDGVWEVENESGERFGKHRVENVLKQSSRLSSQEIVNTIILEAETFRGSARQGDDVTLLALKFR